LLDQRRIRWPPNENKPETILETCWRTSANVKRWSLCAETGAVPVLDYQDTTAACPAVRLEHEIVVAANSRGKVPQRRVGVTTA